MKDTTDSKKFVGKFVGRYIALAFIIGVISFALEDNSNIVYNNIRVLGDIYICIPRMLEQASSYGHSLTISNNISSKFNYQKTKISYKRGCKKSIKTN